MKLICRSSPRKTRPPDWPYFQQLFSPHLLFKKSSSPPLNRRHRKRSTGLCSEFSCTYCYMYLLCILDWKGSTLTMVGSGLMLEKFIEITTRLLKMNFPAWQLFLKTLPEKGWPQYLGNYIDYSDGTYYLFGQIHQWYKMRLYKYTQTHKKVLKKKLSFSLEKDIIFRFHIYFSASFGFRFLVSDI